VNALLDIGFAPVGVGGGAEDFVLPKDRATYVGLAKVSSSAGEVDIEAVAALHPDLIIGLDQPPIGSVRAKLAGIAPTAVFAWDTPAEWPKLVASVTTAVGCAGDEAALEGRYRARTAKLRNDHGDALRRIHWDLITGSPDQAYVWLANSDVGVVLADGGVQLASASGGKSLGTNPGGSVPVSFERLGALGTADAIAVRAGMDGQPDALTKTLMQQPTFKALPAARAGRVFPLRRFFPFSYGQGIALLDEFDPILTRLRT
jgi:iron complex transport system substrate-binding protein